MSNQFHKDLPAADIHIPHAFVYADTTARLAAVSGDFTDPGDLFKVARQTGDQTYWVLEQITPSVVWNQLGGGIATLAFDTITDPAVNAAVTQEVVDVFDGTIITLTGAGNAQTIADPSNTGLNRCFSVINHSTSTDMLIVNGHILDPGHHIEFCWEGSAWTEPADPVKPIGSAFVVGNSTVTTISTQNTWVDVALGTVTAGSIINRWTLTDSASGELTYNGPQGFTGALALTISAVSGGAAQEFHFRVVKNGSVLDDVIEATRDIGTTIGNLTLLVPLSVIADDTIQLQVENADGTSDITLIDVVFHVE